MPLVKLIYRTKHIFLPLLYLNKPTGYCEHRDIPLLAAVFPRYCAEFTAYGARHCFYGARHCFFGKSEKMAGICAQSSDKTKMILDFTAVLRYI